MPINGKSQGTIAQPDTVPLSYITHVMDVLLEHGQNVLPILSVANISHSILSNLDANIPRSSYYLFLEKLLAKIKIDGLGFKVGRKFTFTDYGILSYASMSSANILEGIKVFFHYQAILGSDSMTTEVLDVSGDMATISLNRVSYQESICRYEAELFMAQWVSSVKSINQLGVPLEFFRIDVSYSKPEYAHLYSECISCEIYYNQPTNKIYFKHDQLNQSGDIMLDDEAAQYYQQRCETVLNSLKSQCGLIDKVRALIKEYPELSQTPEEIAKHLKMSYRSLRRRLSEDGKSIKKISDEIRMDLASKYLTETQLTTQEIAFLLGFSETPNFHRAFKRWWKKTPGEYREVYRRH